MSQKGGCEGDDHTAKVELMKDLGIEKGERDRVLKVVRDKSISDKHFIFYIQSFKVHSHKQTSPGVEIEQSKSKLGTETQAAHYQSLSV